MKPTPLRGVNAAGLPLHPVCRNANSRVHIVVTVGHKHLTCVTLPEGTGEIHLVQLDPFDHGLIELQLRKPDGSFELYPVKRAIRTFMRFAKEKGITQGAREALEELKQKA
jgi:hypothetical protein